MPFMDELRRHNVFNENGITGGRSSYYGDPGSVSSGSMQQQINPADEINNLMPVFNQIRNRELEDFKAKQEFVSDLGIRQNRLQQMDLDRKPMNVQYGGSSPADPNVITPLQREGLNLEHEKLAADKNKSTFDMGVEKGKLALDEKKNSQIYDTKTADLERKSAEATQRLQLAYDTLQAKQGDVQAQLAFHQAEREASDARHALDLAHKEKELEELRTLHAAQIADLEGKRDQSGSSTEVQSKDEKTGAITTTTKKGAKSNKTIRVIAPDGTHGTFPADEPLPKGYTRIN